MLSSLDVPLSSDTSPSSSKSFFLQSNSLTLLGNCLSVHFMYSSFVQPCSTSDKESLLFLCVFLHGGISDRVITLASLLHLSQKMCCPASSIDGFFLSKQFTYTNSSSSMAVLVSVSQSVPSTGKC